ncbi:histidine phosphatase family protein [Demequina sediminicola]|uniref:histidine phosphatase family protein n=1 Tax=Demequina sediminicola TaxID=1095026 RepID=UPI0007844989|nr:histidine phosphatase family protein [Demequina sediminicola]
MQVYVIRHGQTEWNALGLLQGASEVPLAPEGLRQAEATAEAMATLVGPDVTVVSSPLSRANETAQALARRVGVEVAVDDRLRERAYGVWEGITPQERASKWPAELEAWHTHGEPNIPGFESHNLVRQRMIAALEDWADAVREQNTRGADADGTLAVFTHGSASRVGLQGILGIPLSHRTLGNLGNAAWSRLTRRERGDWTLERHHLTVETVVTT